MTKDEDDGYGAGGYRKGSAAEIATRTLMEGRFSRTEVMRELRESHSESNNWSVTISTVIADLKARGWREEGFYRLRPPPLVRRKARPVHRRRPLVEEAKRVELNAAQQAAIKAAIEAWQDALSGA